MTDDTFRPEESLDPQDWDAMRALGHRMLDDMFDFAQTVDKRPVWQPIPAETKARLREPLPIEPQGAESAYTQFLSDILPYPLGNQHPRFWGWVLGNGTITGMLADMLIGGMNTNTGGAEHSANYVELQVLDWCKELFGYPAEASGVLVSGGSMANLVGLTVARYAKAEHDVRREGLHASPRKPVLYASAEAHSSIQKAVELLGLGSEALRKIPVNDADEIRVDELEAAIARDKAVGLYPFCVVGAAGTTNLGAFDDLHALADICEREGLWFHVDGAFGALAALSPDLRHLTSGMERGDSLAFDLHKFMYMPYEIGCILVRDEEKHRRAFSLTPDYLAHSGERGVASGAVWFSNYGVQLSRRFRALAAWMQLKEHGVAKHGRIIQQNIDQARHLATLVDAEPTLERLAPVPLNIVLFRYKADGLSEESLDALNRELLLRIHESGIAVPSYTLVRGTYVLRVCVTNHRSRREDFDLFVRETVRIGNELAEMMREKS